MPITVPSIDMIEIGAGGGSIAHVDELGLLKVGPRKRRGRSRAGLLWPRRHECLRHRRRPGARPARCGQFSRRRHAARPRARRGSDAAARRAARRFDARRRLWHLPRGRRVDGGGRTRARHRPRRRLSRPAAAGVRRRRSDPRLRRRRAARQLRGDLPADGQRALRVRHAGDAGAAGPGARRPVPRQCGGLERGRCADRRDGGGRPQGAGRGRPARRQHRLRFRRRPALLRPAGRGHGAARG